MRALTIKQDSLAAFERDGYYLVKGMALRTTRAGTKPQMSHCDLCKTHNTRFKKMTKAVKDWVQKQLPNEHPALNGDSLQA